MEKGNTKERLLYLYNLARMANLCKTQKEFADFLRMNENTISSAMRGKSAYLTDNFFIKIENALEEAGVRIDGDNNVVQTGDNNTNTPQDATSLAILRELSAAREMYDRHLSRVLEQNSELLKMIRNEH